MIHSSNGRDLVSSFIFTLNSWAVNLKFRLMSANGREYCFQNEDKVFEETISRKFFRFIQEKNSLRVSDIDVEILK